MTAVLTKSGEETQRPREEGHVTAEAEIGMMQLQAKKHHRCSATTRSQQEAKKDPPLEPSEGEWLCCHLDPRLLVSRAVRK